MSPFLGVSMILKDAEALIRANLARYAHELDEIVVAVDDSTTDGTLRALERLGARVKLITWRGDFSYARNESRLLARSRWILVLDGDDFMLPADVKRLRKQLMRLDRPAVVLLNVTEELAAGDRPLTYEQVRCFPNLEGAEWIGLVHEQIGNSLAAMGVPGFQSGLPILHRGYSDLPTALAKSARNLPLIAAEVALRPERSHLWVDMVRSQWNLGLLDAAYDLSLTLPTRNLNDIGREMGCAVLHGLANTITDPQMRANLLDVAVSLAPESPYAILTRAATLGVTDPPAALAMLEGYDVPLSRVALPKAALLDAAAKLREMLHALPQA